MKQKVIVHFAIAGLAILLTGAVAVSTIDKLIIEPLLVDSFGGLTERYIQFREQMGPIVPPGVMYEEALASLSKGDWSFLENWFFTFDGETLYVPEDSALAKELQLPARIQIREDLKTGQIYLFSAPLTDGKAGLFTGMAAFKAPDFMPYEKDFPLDRYAADELAPRRVVMEAVLKPSADAWADLMLNRNADETSSLATGGMMSMSMPSDLTDSFWLYLEPQPETINLQIFSPEYFTNSAEIYSCTDLVSGVWSIAAQNLYPTATNPAVWDAGGYAVRFMTVGDMHLDSDGDTLPDAREQLIYKTSKDSADTDGDGLDDGAEIETYATNPLSVDTDGDGLPDGWEIQYGLNPLDDSGEHGGDGDLDQDGVRNDTEYQRGTDPADGQDVTRETSAWAPFVVNAYSLTRSGNILFVSGSTNLCALDLSNPLLPDVLTEIHTSGFGDLETAADGDYVYGFSSRTNGLHVFHCEQPAGLQYVGNIPLPAGKAGYVPSRGLTVQDGYLYVWDNAIEIYSLTNPASPQWVGAVPDLSTEENSFFVCAFYADGNHVYAGYEAAGFSVWDVSDRSAPVLENFLSSTLSAYGFIRESDRLYVAEQGWDEEWIEYTSRISVLDVSAGFPTHAAPLAMLNYEYPFYLLNQLVGDEAFLYAYEKGSEKILVFDTSVPTLLQETNALFLGYSVNDIELYDSALYLAAGSKGLMVVDLSDPAEPEVVHATGADEDVIDLTGTGDTVYVWRSSGDVMMLDASNVSGLVPLAEFKASGSSGVHVASNQVYVAMGSRGISLYDPGPSNLLMKISELDTALSLDSVTVHGNYAYCGSLSGQALITLDFSDPENPQEVCTNSSLGLIDRLMVSGDRLYAASFDQGLLMFDLSNPSMPVQTGQFSTRSCFRDLCVSSNWVYAADGINGLLVIDVTDPESPVQVGQLKLDYARRLAFSGDRICVTGYKSVYFIDVSDPQHPVLQQEITLAAESVAVCATTEFFHVLDKSNRLHTYFIP
jgi:hypothetical protein